MHTGLRSQVNAQTPSKGESDANNRKAQWLHISHDGGVMATGYGCHKMSLVNDSISHPFVYESK